MTLPRTFGTITSPGPTGYLDDNFNSLDSLKAPIASPTLTGTTSAVDVSISGTLAVTGATTLSGTVHIVGAATFDANPAGRLLGSTYTPTITASTNYSVAPTVATALQYQRVGSIISVMGSFNMTTTAAGFAKFSFTLPFTASVPGSGSGSVDNGTGMVAAGFASNGAGAVYLQHYSSGTAASVGGFTYTYNTNQ